MLDIFCPTYKRPRALEPVLRELRANTTNEFRLYFGVEPDDTETLKVLSSGFEGVTTVVNKYEQGYSNTIQSMYEESDGEFFVHINDDFKFLKGWDEAPLAHFATPHIMVVGVSEREHSTLSAVSMVRRSYIETQSGVVDMPNRVFYPYGHNYQDTEFTETAKSRGVWVGCAVPAILHQHPGIIGGDKDYTYQKNDALVAQDEALFRSREHLWKL